MPSFDVVSQVDMQEVDNALNQARKEIEQRYDFKDSKTEITLEKEGVEIKGLLINSSDDYKVKAALDILQSKLVRRNVSLKSLVPGKVEPAGGGRSKQLLKIQQGIDTEKARAIVKAVKDSKVKVQSQIQGDQVRISGKKRDDLQEAIALLKQQDYGLPLQFVNFRD
jgi:cyclic-di-GMP-binding protein